MALQLYDVNYFIIILCVIIHMALGVLWYSKYLFQATWMRLAKITPAQQREEKENRGKNILFAFVASFILIFMLSQTIKAPDINLYSESLEMAFWIWLGFIATVMTGMVLWEGKSWRLYLINSLYYLVSMQVSATILYFWS